jgi:hypothetical protein
MRISTQAAASTPPADETRLGEICLTKPRSRAGLAGLALLLAPLATASAATLDVGPDRTLKAPSEAAKIAHDGDIVRIDPGEYYDCAFWRANNLTIEGTGDGVVLTDVACAGKASFVISGNNATVRRLTFTRIRVGDGNGAGIRAEGRNLTVEHSRFINNQVGLLAGDLPGSSIVIRDSEFTDNGACNDRTCVGAIIAGQGALLEITGSHFSATKGGHQVVSDADALVVTNTVIEDGPQGTSSYLIQHGGPGSVTLQANTLEKGRNTTNRRAAVLLDAPMGHTGPLLFRANRFINDTSAPGVFVVNWTSGDPVMQDNQVQSPRDTELTDAGRLRHRLIVLAQQTKALLRHLAGLLLHPLFDLLHIKI